MYNSIATNERNQLQGINDSRMYSCTLWGVCCFHLQVGAAPAASRHNWFDGVVQNGVNGRLQTIRRPGHRCRAVPGSYSGLRDGEWNKVVQALGSVPMRRWSAALNANTPPLSCGRIVSGFTQHHIIRPPRPISNLDIDIICYICIYLLYLYICNVHSVQKPS